jgi:hypothetical protein
MKVRSPPAAAGGEPVADDRFSFARLAAVAVGGVEAAPTGEGERIT